jgi:uncharacterized protein YndB with AHSA1/START domain
MAMSPSATAKVTLPTDEQILVTREFDAPPHLVYRAWTTPALVKRWWCGQRGEMTLAEIDLRVGGTWRYVMIAHGGHEVGFHGEFREIVPNERIVSTEVYEGPWPADGDPAITTVTFTATDGGGTRLEQLMQVGSREERDAIVATGMETGIHEQLDLLDELARGLA